jgi:hypothetical protein
MNRGTTHFVPWMSLDTYLAAPLMEPGYQVHPYHRRLAMSRLDVNSVRCEALFASALQRSQSPTPTQVRQAITAVVRDLGSRGCAAWVAQEFGDHPETAVVRMRWARQLVAEAFQVAPARQPTPTPAGYLLAA